MGLAALAKATVRLAACLAALAVAKYPRVRGYGITVLWQSAVGLLRPGVVLVAYLFNDRTPHPSLFLKEMDRYWSNQQRLAASQWVHPL
uniref:Putative secreted protein n=1 Tax=Anopheles triannulatus TaxID=58253 RepID=A0A2M4B4D6_9DIPT